LVLLAALLVAACDYWPRDLEPLAQSITQQVSGETTAWLVAGDLLVIDVAGSPHYRAAQAELEGLAGGIAEQAVAFATAPLESIVITFHEGAMSEDPEKMREFIFLVVDNRPELQPNLDFDATGPLTPDQLQAAIGRLDESMTPERRICVRREMENRARAAGDPETLDPASIEFLSALSAATWDELEAFGKRIILLQAIATEAMFACAGAGKPGAVD
jgi:hypothetical protein